MRTTRDVRAPRAPRAARPSPPARRALAQHGTATEEKTRDEDDNRRRDARRVARGSGAFHVRDEEGGAGLRICHRRTLRACPKRSSRRHEYKWRSESIHPAGRAAEQFEVSAGYSSRSTRRRYDQKRCDGTMGRIYGARAVNREPQHPELHRINVEATPSNCPTLTPCAILHSTKESTGGYRRLRSGRTSRTPL